MLYQRYLASYSKSKIFKENCNVMDKNLAMLKTTINTENKKKVLLAPSLSLEI